jgi:serine/threonine protein kinase
MRALSNNVQSPSRQCRANCSSWDFSHQTLVNSIVPLGLDHAYRTADSISLVSVPSSMKGQEASDGMLMVEKRSIYRQERKGAVDALKKGSLHNEWDVWKKHQAQIDTSNLVKLFGLTDEDSPDGSSSARLYSEHCSGGDVDSSMLGNASCRLPDDSSIVNRAKASQHPRSSLAGQEEGGALAFCGLCEEQVKEIALDVVVGLNALHQIGLIHGDIKPSNIFINQSREQGKDSYLIGDYGSLREVGTQNLSYFSAGFVSTIEYSSPELLLDGSSKAKQSSDVYALGVMMQELLLGHLPKTSLEIRRFFDEEESQPNGGGRRAAIDRYQKGSKDHPSINHQMRQFINPETGFGLSKGLISAIESLSNASETVRPANASEVMKLNWFSSGLISSGRGHLLGGLKATRAYEKWLRDWEPETIDLEWE